jgi:hypothetical protein
MDDCGRNSGRRYHVRGPLNLAHVEHELFGRPLDSSSVTGTSENADFAKAWEKFKNSYADGDELYFARSDRRSWERLNGWRGYVLIRQNKVVNTLTTFLN